LRDGCPPLREIMRKLKLTVNEKKPRICKVSEGSSTSWVTRSGGFTQREPARRAWVIGHQRRASSVWYRTGTWQETTELVGKLNRTLRGWANYFNVGTVSKGTERFDNYTAVRLRPRLRIKHKVRRCKGGTYPLSHLYGHFGFPRLTALGRDLVGEGARSCPRAGCVMWRRHLCGVSLRWSLPAPRNDF
jgi:hypothetical protein